MIEIADPERALAVGYAPVDARAPLAVLFALDERLGAVVAGTTETGIGLIRLAWWREALTALDAATPPPEPLLAAVATSILPAGVSGATLAGLEDGWAALLDPVPGAESVARHGRERGATLFRIAGTILGTDDLRLDVAGAGWALADLAHRHSSPEIRGLARAQAAASLDGMPRTVWPRPARPLGALATLAARDARSVAARRQGSPGRVARMLALRLTGR